MKRCVFRGIAKPKETVDLMAIGVLVQQQGQQVVRAWTAKRFKRDWTWLIGIDVPQKCPGTIHPSITHTHSLKLSVYSATIITTAHATASLCQAQR
jgi:hypothetical protein